VEALIVLLQQKRMISKMSRSEIMRCMRCGRIVDEKSAFVIHIRNRNDVLFHDVIFSRKEPSDGCVVHMQADRECRGQISGFIKKIIIKLQFSESCDTSFLDQLSV
jgi:hypothetical protein